MNREETIFAEAVAKPQAERAAFLHDACGGDAGLRASVEALLRANDETRGILESPVQIPPAEHVGSTVGPYKLLEKIGEGGMGVVYMAEQTHPVRRMVALKIIKPGMDSGQVIARFEAERQALAMMEHPNVARVLDAGTTESGRPYFAMELVKGIPITEYCDQARLTTRQRLELFIQVCHAVQHAHTKGIIHRDLKPGNVLVTLHDDRPVPKVIDFGIAKATGAAGGRLTDRTLFTQFAQMMGTPMYMSPEQAALSAVDVDTRSDVYSLGVLLYELLTGTTPFDKQRLGQAAYEEIRRIIREEDPPRPSTRLSTLGEKLTTVSSQRHTDPKRLGQLVRGELDWIVMKSLEKDRARRYETVNALAADVQRHLRDQPVEACPPSAAYRFRKFARRNKPVLVTTLLIGSALLLGVIVSTWQGVRAREQKREADRQRDAAVAEKRRADEEAAIAKAVRQFLQRDLLSQAELENQNARDHVPSPDITVREAIDRAAASVHQAFAGQPRVEAEIRRTLGGTYFGLGERDAAIKQYEAGLAALRPVAGDEDPLVLKLIEWLAVVRGDDESERQLIGVIETRRRVWGSDDLDTCAALNSLGMHYMVQRRFSDAEPVLKESLEGMIRQHGDKHVNAHAPMINLGVVYLDLGRLDEAEALIRRAHETAREREGVNHVDTLQALGHLADLLKKRGRLDEVDAIYADMLSAQRERYGISHPQTTQVLWNYLKFLRDLRRGSETVVGPLTELAEAYMSSQRDATVRDMRTLLEFARTLAVFKRDEAETYFRRALAISKGRWHNPAERADALLGLVMFLNERLRHREAQELLTELWEWIETRPPQSTAGPALWDVARRRVVNYTALGQRDLARGAYDRAVKIQPPKTRDINTLAWVLAIGRDPAGRDPEWAVELAQQAVERAPTSYELWNTLGAAQYRMARYRDALAALEKSEQLRQDGNRVESCENCFFLAMTHQRLGNLPLARQWYDRGVQAMRPGVEFHSIFRAEAEQVLGIVPPATTQSVTRQAGQDSGS